MSRKLSIKRSWYGFIPFLNVYSFGKLSDCSMSRKDVRLRSALTTVYVLSRIAGIISFSAIISFLIKLFFAADLAVYNGEELDPTVFSSLTGIYFTLLLTALFSLIYAIINAACATRIYKRFNASFPVLLAFLGIILPILLPFFIYSLCKNDPLEKHAFSHEDEASVFKIE